jgi:hypothetical protein
MSALDTAFLDVTKTLSAHLAAEPDDPRALFLAALVSELVGEAPPALREAARRAPASAPGCQGAVVAMWRDLVRHEAMTPARALALAARLENVLEHPAALAFLAEEAEPHHEAAELLRAAVRRRFPAFDLETPRIDRGVLEALGVPLDTPGVTLRLHADGQVALLAALEARLTLDAPGRGRFVDRGVHRGSGWAVDESYAQGCARGEFFSPWHDGSAYQQPTPWLTWVAKAAMSVCVSAGASQGKTVRRRKVRR